MDRVAFVDDQLTTFKDSLKLYREMTESNFAQWVDKGPQFFDKPAFKSRESEPFIKMTEEAPIRLSQRLI